MLATAFRKVSWVFPVLAALALSGCGGSNGITVKGKVTLDGTAVENGYISFYPEDGQGGTIGGNISNGEYTITDVPLGKKKVQVTITEVVASPSENPGKSREDANAERLKHMKKRGRPARSGSQDLEGNNRVVDISRGMEDLNIELKTSKRRR
ncbi:MAG TPA: hypothetical protein VG013_20460 [Gemmataceae bacterium]|nr:hypothetical protein [Gemmataceae bacterium]